MRARSGRPWLFLVIAMLFAGLAISNMAFEILSPTQNVVLRAMAWGVAIINAVIAVGYVALASMVDKP